MVLFTAAICILYLLGLMSVYILINPIVFKTERTSKYETPSSKRIEHLEIQLPGNQHLSAVLYKTSSIQKGVILFLHGVRGNLDRFQFQSQQFVSRGYSVLLPDYRGYGKSKGELSETSLTEDVTACLDWLAKRHREDSIIIYAMDFLVPIACYVNTMLPARLLILENPVYSLRSWIKFRYPAFFLPYELKYDFNTYEYLHDCLSPVYVIRPNKKAACTLIEAQNLKLLLKDPDTFIQLDDRPNENIYELESFQNHLDRILNFESL
ncbi:MAG: alpha/beta hydrolase [Saprospiraceae bacterium]|nr:alpha/beta hydrolase [Saprospiraceae bacterium]